MPQRQIVPLLRATAAAGLLALTVAGCSMGSGLALSTSKVQGYALSQDALAQIRPGQSQDLVVVVLGSPQTVNAFTEGDAWYYVETKVDQTAFGLTTVRERTVLAVYFDKNKKVTETAVYGAQDGKAIVIEGRKTPSYGVDRTFLEQLLGSMFG